MMWDKIDFNAALEDCKSVRDGIKSDEDFQNADSGLVMYYLNTIVKALEIATIVKHGHWIETRRYRDADGCIVSDYSCSECGSVLRETNPDDRDSEFYCYHCGAKMDGDAK